jgi:PKHD-type hydroxylase
VIIVIDNILEREELKAIAQKLEESSFVDGKKTAGWHAKLVKNNDQLDRQDPHHPELLATVENALKRNSLFKAAIQPKFIHTILFSRYQAGMYYDTHVDNSLMGGDNFCRSDVSFTLFLSDPTSYSGGELIIEGASDDRSYKLQAGSAVFYPSSSLHRVESVKEGTRLVVVGWIQSLTRDANKREILFDLDTVRRSVFAKEGKTIEFDLLSKTYSNLLRLWVE